MIKNKKNKKNKKNIEEKALIYLKQGVDNYARRYLRKLKKIKLKNT